MVIDRKTPLSGCKEAPDMCRYGKFQRVTKQGIEGLPAGTCEPEIDIPITVCHYPPRTTKWNKIEHRMFSFIRMNSKGKLFVSCETTNGFKAAVSEGNNKYPTGVKFSDADFAKV